MPYENSTNKSTIRRLFDQPILQAWRRETERSLTYMGLPGPEIHDFIEWRDLLAPERTAVESAGGGAGGRVAAREVGRRLTANVLAHGLSSGFQLLWGDIEDIILDAVDLYGNPPQMNNGDAAIRRRFEYDFINLDFDGGLGYLRKNSRPRRVEALKKLFERQDGHSFLLFMTLNVRHKLGDSLNAYVKDLRETHRDVGDLAVLDWHIDRKLEENRLKLVVPSLVRAAAELRGFKCRCYPQVSYIGHNQARMVHFAFAFRTRPLDLKSFSEQSERDILLLPLLRCANGDLSLDVGPVGADPDRLKSELGFMSNDVCEMLLSSDPLRHTGPLVRREGTPR